MEKTLKIVITLIAMAIVFLSLFLVYVTTSPRVTQTATVTYTYISPTTIYTYSHEHTSQYSAAALASLVIAIPTDLSTVDIHFATGVADFEVLGKVYESLFRIAMDGGRLVYVPWLVKYYKQLNDTAWLFVIRDNIYFHNGKKLDAWDVKASLERSMRISPIGRMLLTDASGKPVISEIDVLNSTALVMRLSKPFTPLIEHLAHLATAIMPRDIAEKYWNGPINSTADVIGTGPFKLVSYEKGSKATLARFDGYWGRAPGVSELVYLILPDSSARIASILSGSADIVVGVSPDDVDRLRASGIVVYNVTGVRLVLVAINCKRVPDPRVRQAMNYAVDREAIVKSLLKGFATPADSVASTVFPNVYIQKPYEYNVSRAIELLREAGFTNKTLKLLVSTRSPKDAQLAQAIQQYLNAVGINVVIEQIEHTAFLKKVFTYHDFDLAIYGPSPSSLYYALTYWRTNASLNGPLYSNPTYDKLLDEIASEPNETRRALLYRDAQEMLWRDAPAIWLYYENIIVAAKPSVKGLQILPFQMLVLDNVFVEQR